MKKALEYIVAQIVDDPKKVEISENEDNGMINFAIKEDKRVNVNLLELEV